MSKPEILSETNGAFLIGEKMRDGEIFAAGKIGHTEFRTMYFGKFGPSFHPTQESLFSVAGVFPKSGSAIAGFLKEMYASLAFIDILPVHAKIEGFIDSNRLTPVPKNYEADLITKCSPNCTLVELRSLEPYYFNNPWSQHLQGKRVLVISPFTESIKKQYEKRSMIWNDDRILPEFELITLQHQFSPSITGASTYEDWVSMVEDLRNKIAKIDFDVALIGTGASSIPLAAYCKSIEKTAIHLGGSLQILFGIKGARWDNHLIGREFYNQHWTRPSREETPQNYKISENGCYW
jgi:hypothetical protein